MQCPNTKASQRNSWLSTTRPSCRTEPSLSTSTITTASCLTEVKHSRASKKFHKKFNHLDSKRLFTALITKTYSQAQSKEVSWFLYQEVWLWTKTTSSNSLKSSTSAPMAKADSTVTTTSSQLSCDHHSLHLFVFIHFFVTERFQECSF